MNKKKQEVLDAVIEALETGEPPPPLCKNCKHRAWLDYCDIRRTPQRDLVFGKVRPTGDWTQCVIAREHLHICGPKGHKFEQRKGFKQWLRSDWLMWVVVLGLSFICGLAVWCLSLLIRWLI